MVLYIGKDRRLHIPAILEACGLAGTAGQQPRPLVDADIDHRLDAVVLDLVEQRPQMLAFLGRIADSRVLRRGAGNLQNLVIAAALHQKAGRGVTGLAGIQHAFRHRYLDAFLQIAICKDQVRRLAAKLQRDPLDRVGRILSHRLAGAR